MNNATITKRPAGRVIPEVAKQIANKLGYLSVAQMIDEAMVDVGNARQIAATLSERSGIPITKQAIIARLHHMGYRFIDGEWVEPGDIEQN